MRAFRTGSGQKFVARATPDLAAVAALSLAIVGCAELDPIEPDVCGNGVIEKDEDCENAEEIDGTCGTECFFICGEQPSGDTVECPSGWSCGVDGFCYQGLQGARFEN